MKRKLPIAETAIDSLSFGFKHLGTVVRLGWLPVALSVGLLVLAGYVVASALPLSEMIDAVQEEMADARGGHGFDFPNEPRPGSGESIYVDEIDPDLAARLPLALLLALMASLTFLPLAVLFFRVAAGDAAVPTGFFYWKWGGRETRTLFTIVLYTLLVWLAFPLFYQFITVVGSSVSASLLPVISLIAFIATLWLYVRTTLLVPAAAVENDMNALRAFVVTGGNVFRIIGSLIVYGCLMLVVIFLAYVVGGLVLVALVSVAASAGEYTATGTILMAIATIIGVVISIGGIIFVNLAWIGWRGKAWAALRDEASDGSMETI